jgi:hypothetical protein
VSVEGRARLRVRPIHEHRLDNVEINREQETAREPQRVAVPPVELAPTLGVAR